MLQRIVFLSAALVLALLVLPLGSVSDARAGALETASSAAGAEETTDETSDETVSQTADQPEEPETAERDTADTAAEAETTATATEETIETAETADTLTVLLPDGSVETMALETYLWGVVAAEMPANFRAEALKAQAVAARTYTLYQLSHEKEAHPEADLCTDYSCCQAWISREDRLAAWPEEEQSTYADRITASLSLTLGQYLTWEGEPILAVFHASSAGTTRSALSVWGSDLPYLISVESPEGEGDTPNYYSVVTFTPEEFAALLLEAYPEADLSGETADWFGAVETDESGAPARVTVGGVTLTAQELRSLCSLRSATFEIECGAEEITFYVTGYGHGVGMSQYGANALANEGMSYEEILAHYYPGTALETLE